MGRRLLLASLLATLAGAPGCASEPATRRAAPVRVEVETGTGTFTAELDAASAPGTVANFLRYVDAGLFDGGRFHRTVRDGNQPGDAIRIDVVQGGPDPSNAKRGFPPIALESTKRTGLRHRDGTLSMARADPDSATADFFVCIGDQPELDHGGRRNPDGQGFAAFGRVVEGMDVVRAIHGAHATGQRLDPPVPIVRARRRP